jgi:hypothetical protein
MSEPDEGSEHVVRLMLAVEKHIAFLEGAMGIEMTQVYREDDVILSDVAGLDPNIPCRLVFPSKTSASGWMDDSLLFATPEELRVFLDRVELLFRIARAQQRGE